MCISAMASWSLSKLLLTKVEALLFTLQEKMMKVGNGLVVDYEGDSCYFYQGPEGRTNGTF